MVAVSVASFAALRQLMAGKSKAGGKQKLRLHMYDHCPFCIRVELVLGRFGIPYERVLYGYGDMKGPTALSGKKQLPLLEGLESVELPAGLRGIIESLDIVAYLTNAYNLSLPCDTQRGDIKRWRARFDAVRRPLTRPRILKMEVKDWATEADIKYAKAKYTKNSGNPRYYEDAEARTPELLQEFNSLLVEFEGLLKGEDTLDAWGFGMADVKLLPDFRSMTCVAGIKWPKRVWDYVSGNFGKAGIALYNGV